MFDIKNKFYCVLFFNLLLMNNLFSQLNSFYEDWEPRVLNFPENSLLQNDPTSSSNVTINFNTSNILGDILPSHFGTNLTHFLGESVLNQADFMDNIKGLNNFTFPILLHSPLYTLFHINPL